MGLTNTNPATGDGGARQGIAFRQNEPAELNSQNQAKQVIPAELTGSDTCTSAGITAQGHAPVLALCRALLAQGLDPDAALTVYRNGAEALRIRRIGEAAKLTVRDDDRGPRFRRWEPSQSRAEAAPMRSNGGAAQ